MTIVIPAYKPDEKLLGVIEDLQKISSAAILLVDDGGGELYRPIFEKAEKMGCRVLIHPENRGKGAALKTALRYLSDHAEKDEAICCADADGQHLAVDIVRCLEEAKAHPGELILGGRSFRGDVPARSIFGNTVARHTFRFLMGKRVFDTQTGLRAFTASLCPLFCEVEGDRYEYEMQQLCDACKKNIPIREIEIQTVYLEENKSSHFNPVRDAMRVYKILFRNATSPVFQFLKFALSSGTAWLIDIVGYALFFHLFSPLISATIAIPLSILIARIFSSLVNFAINRKLVFHSAENMKKTLVLYGLLVVAMYFANSALTVFFAAKNLHHILSFILAQLICFPINFILQKKCIFAQNKKGSA